MNHGVIPDSEEEIPPLIPQNPKWIFLGVDYSARVEDIPRISQRTQTPRVPNSKNLSDEFVTTSRPQQRGQTIEPPIGEQHLPRERLTTGLPSQVEDARGSQPAEPSIEEPFERNLPRRRRFDFKTWVEADKKIHEYVYQRRFNNYYGPMSDSEDDDYDLPETHPQQADQDTPMVDDDSTQSSDGSDHSNEDSDNDTGSSITASSSRFYGKSRIILSDSESDEDLPLVDRRLKSAIPAAPDEQPESSESLGQAIEDFSGIDYMQPKSRPHRGKSTQTHIDFDVIQLAEHAGKTAPHSLRIAARTARNRSRIQSARRSAAGFGRSNAEGHKSAAQRSRTQATRRSPTKVFVNQSDETMRILRKWARGDLVYDHIIPSTSKEATPQKRARTSKKAFAAKLPSKHRKHVEQPNDSFRTSILEQQAGGSSKYPRDSARTLSLDRNGKVGANDFSSRSNIRAKSISPGLTDTSSRSATFESPRRTIKEVENQTTAPQSSSKPRSRLNSSCEGLSSHGISTSAVRVTLESPSRRLSIGMFNGQTFIGSRLLDMFDGPSMWSLSSTVPIPSNFGTPLKEASVEQIADDTQLIYSLMDSLDDALYSELYKYFLTGTAFLCDERQIVELSLKKFVARQWLRLGRSLLKFALKRLQYCQAKNLRAHKNRISKYERSRWLIQLTLLVVEASLIVSQHVGLFEESTARKGKMLALWTLFYLQNSISLQIDRSGVHSLDIHFIGAELLLTVHKFRAYDETLSKIFTRVQQPEPYWHLIILLSSSDYEWGGSDFGRSRNDLGHWYDWNIVRNLIKITIHLDPHLVMLYIHRLLTHWHWPQSPDMIIDLFSYFVKLRYYADPKGESIALPRFLLTSNFDGSNIPDQSFSLFLELLGFTMRNLKISGNCLQNEAESSLTLLRRLASRVTPLSTLEFPETKEVSLSDLSSASHQYGLLIVLLRVLNEDMRPPVAQFRDLVVLKSTHWAMRVKAVSAWDIIVRLTTRAEDRAECRRWMLDILDGGKFAEPVISSALDKVLEYWRSTAVPIVRMAQVGLESAFANTRKKVWRMVAMAKLSATELEDICQWQLHFTVENDLLAMARIIAQCHNDKNLIHRWTAKLASKDIKKAHLVYTDLFATGVFNQADIIPVAPFLVESALAPEITEEEAMLLKSAHLTNSEYQAASHQSFSLAERRSILRKLIDIIRTSEQHCELALRLADTWSRKLVEQGPASSTLLMSVYLPLINELRLLIQPVYPSLVKEMTSPMLLDEYSRAVETMQTNLLNLLDGRNNSSSYYFFIYRLRSLLPANGEPLRNTTSGSDNFYEEIHDNQYISDLTTALQVPSDPRKERLMTVKLLQMYESIFALAQKTFKRTRKSSLPLILPTLVKSARVATRWKFSFSRELGHFLYNVASYFSTLMKYHSELIRNSFTLKLLEEFSLLGLKWLDQSAQSRKSGYIGSHQPSSLRPIALPKPFRAIRNTVESIFEDLRTLEEPVYKSRPDGDLSSQSMENPSFPPPLPTSLQNESFANNLIYAFKTESIVEDRIEGAISSKNYKGLKLFKRHLEVFALAYDPDD